MRHDFYTRRAVRRGNEPWRIPVAIILLIGGIVIAIIKAIDAIDYLFPNWFTNFKIFIVRVSHSGTGLFLGIIIFGIVAYSLFLFRKRNQYYYGVVESSISVVGLYKITQELQVDNADIVGVFGALYLCVRGLNNIDEGSRHKDWHSTWAGKKWAKLKSRKQKQIVEATD